MTVRPTVAQVRAIRPFKMGDTALEAYIDQAGNAGYAIETLSTITLDAERTQLWALLAAHFATVMAEPEPTSSRLGSFQVTWGDRGSPGDATNLEASAPGREFKRHWRSRNVGRVLR